MLPHSGVGDEIEREKRKPLAMGNAQFSRMEQREKKVVHDISRYKTSQALKRPKPHNFSTIKCPKCISFSVTAIQINLVFLFVKNPPINVLFFRYTASFQKRLDLKALCEDVKSMLPSIYLATYCYHCSECNTSFLLAIYCVFTLTMYCQNCFSAKPAGFPLAMYCFVTGSVLLPLFECEPTGFPLAMYCYHCQNVILVFHWQRTASMLWQYMYCYHCLSVIYPLIFRTAMCSSFLW